LAGAGLVMAQSMVLMRRELKREPFTFAWAGGDSAATLNFAARRQSLSGARLYIRGPLASLRGQDETGRIQRHLWWPDTLPADARRQLRLLEQMSGKSQASSSRKQQ
jgi:toxin CptA